MKKFKEHKKTGLFSNAGILAPLLIFFYLFFFGLISILKYNSFSFDDFDLAVHAQTLYSILHGSIQSSILGVPFLGNHLNFILFLITPVYAVFKSPVTLLLLQTAALGFSAYPIYIIAKEQLPAKFSILALFSYLLYPSLGYVNLYEFHPTVFATFFFSVILYAAYKNRFELFFTFLMLSLLCQENTPLIIAVLGIYLLFIKKPLKWWLSAILIGAVYFWIGTSKLIPYFGKGTIKFIAIYGHLGNSMGEVLKNILIHPAQIIDIILKEQNIKYITQIFGPLLFLPVLSPLALLGALPTLLQHMLSLRETEHTIYYHYTAEMIPFIFFAFIFALKKVLSSKGLRGKENFLAMGFLAVTLAANLMLGPHVNYILHINRFFKTDMVYVMDALVKKIPKDAEVAATFKFLPKLSNRGKLYSFHHVVMGAYTLSNIPYELPLTTEYVLVDFEDWLTFKGNFYNERSGPNLSRVLKDGDFGIVNILDTIVLFKKGVKSDYYLYNILPSEPPISNKTQAIINNEIELIGYEVDKAEAGKGVASFKFYWRCLKDTDKVYGAFLDVLDHNGRVIKQSPRFICYRVYPTNEWKEGKVIEEFYRLLLPVGMPPQSVQVKMGIFDFYTGKIQRVDSGISGVVDNNTMVNLSK